MRLKTVSFLVACSLLVALPLYSQANTGKIVGRVSSSDGTALPGVTITVTSPSLQGSRTAITTVNGDYVLPQLPAGDYDVLFELEGFGTVRTTVKVNTNQVAALDQQMTLSDVREEIVVTGELSTISTEIPAQTTFEKDNIEQLAITRSIEDAVVLAPAVHATGPQSDASINGSAISISGSQSYENLFMVNGVVVNENTRGQAIEFIIEDAVQETTISTSGVSAEYGRFNGGVVNVITKSGGNDFSGSFRTNFDSESWEGKNDLSPEEQDSTKNKTYEATFGGRIIRDKLWFFLAGRDLSRAATQTLPLTGINLPQDQARDRAEAKLTISPTPSHRLIGSYMERNASITNENFSNAALELSVVNDSREDPEDLTSFNYTGVLTPSFFLEAQYSQRNLTLGKGSGGKTTERIGGTWIVDLANFGFLGAPVFCAVCIDNQRNNEDILVKASYFLSTEGAGTHDLIAGYDTFDDINVIENHQSASDFHVWTLNPSIIRGDRAFPVITENGYNRLRWSPVLESTKGMHHETDSVFINDTWRVNDRTSINLGLRYDKNNTKNGAGEVVSDDSKLAPRLGLAYDITGDGGWVLNASYAQYAASINTGANIGGVLGSAGALGSWIWLYNGPAINPDPNAPTEDLVTSEEAIRMIFDWFDSIGGVDNTSQRIGLTIPGLGVQVPNSIITPSSEEFSVGVIKRLGRKGLVRADLVHRNFADFYARITDTTTGQVENPDGSLSDLTLFQNSNDPERKYDGVHTQFSYRFTDRFTLAGNYTWSHAQGDFDGETEGNAALAWGRTEYPELKSFDRNISYGDLQIDQRHKLALWAIYRVLDRDHHRMSVSLLQRYGSGRPIVGTAQSGPGSVAARNYVDVGALGYVEAPPTVNYWYYDRDAFRSDAVSTTDIALNYSFLWKIGGKEFEVFVQPEMLNVFNNDAVVFPNAAILDATNGPYTAFNPFTETPVEGVNYGLGSNFGQPTTDTDYQRPQEFRFSVGFRF